MTEVVRLPGLADVWEHSKSGKRYRIAGTVFNSITDQIDVEYVPLYPCPYPRFIRQLFGHPQAFLSTNEDGQPRFTRVPFTEPDFLPRPRPSQTRQA